MPQPLCPRALSRTILVLSLLLVGGLAGAFAVGQTLERRAADPATSATTAESPAGRWVAAHTAADGIGTWWDIRPNGTLTMFLGAAATAHVSHTADILTVPSGKPDGSTIALEFRITGNIMNLKRPGERDTIFTREGPAPKPSDPLLGRWRPSPPAVYSEDPELAARQKVTTLGVYLFQPDGTQIVRIPFTSREGTWDAAAHTLTLAGEAHAFTYRPTAEALILLDTSDNQKTGTFLPDPLFPQ